MRFGRALRQSLFKGSLFTYSGSELGAPNGGRGDGTASRTALTLADFSQIHFEGSAMCKHGPSAASLPLSGLRFDSAASAISK